MEVVETYIDPHDEVDLAQMSLFVGGRVSNPVMVLDVDSAFFVVYSCIMR